MKRRDAKYELSMMGLDDTISLPLESNFIDKAAFAKFSEAASKVGIVLCLEPGMENGEKLVMHIDAEKYYSARRLTAGRIKKTGHSDNSSISVSRADIFRMKLKDNLTDDEIAKAINMPIATFYRHKKAMFLECGKDIDVKMLDNKKYLDDKKLWYAF